MARRLDNWLRAYAEFTEASEAPEAFNFWTGVSTVAGALRRHVWIDQLKFKWTPNFYIVFVAPPGVVGKSTTSSVGMAILREVDGVKMGPSSLTWQGLTKGLEESKQMVTLVPADNPLEATYLTQSAITCEVSELGTMLNTKDDQLISVLIDLWDGKETIWERWLKSSENTAIENPWINMIASTTPSWLSENFEENMIGGGLTSRMIFVYAEQKRAFVPYISEIIKSDEYERRRLDLVHDLREIGDLRGAFKLTKSAIDFGSEWYIKHWTEPEEHLVENRFQGYRARKQTHIHKLAMVLSAAEGDSLTIDRHHLELALAIVAGVEADMHRVFENIGRSQSSKQMLELASYLRHYRKLTKRDLWRKCMNSMSPKEFSEALDSLVNAGYVRVVAEFGEFQITWIGAPKKATVQEPVDEAPAQTA